MGLKRLPRETTYLPVNGDFRFLGAAGYLAVLAYPDDLDKRDEFLDACRALTIKKITGGYLKKRMITRVSLLKFSKERELNRTLLKAGKIIADKRMAAWKLALPLLFQQTMDVNIDNKTPFTLHRYIKKLYPTENSYSGDLYNENNAYKRIWIPAKPVLHLTFGLQTSLFKSAQKDIESLLCNTDWLKDALHRAEGVRKSICQSDNINIKDEDTIQLLPEK